MANKANAKGAILSHLMTLDDDARGAVWADLLGRAQARRLGRDGLEGTHGDAEQVTRLLQGAARGRNKAEGTRSTCIVICAGICADVREGGDPAAVVAHWVERVGGQTQRGAGDALPSFEGI